MKLANSTRAFLVLFACASCATLALACDAIIGTRDVEFDPNAGDGSAGGGGDASNNNADGNNVVGMDGSTTQDGAGSNDGGTPLTCDASFATDKKNCGGCAQDCSNGNCAAGVCTLVDQQYGAVGIAVDDTHVYAAVADGHVVSCPKTGCSGGATSLFTSDQIEPQRIRVLNGLVYFSNYYEGTGYPTGMYRLPVGAPSTPVRLTPRNQVWTNEINIGADGGTLYWGDDDVPAKGLQYCNLGNCTDAGGTALDANVYVYDSLFLPNGAFVWSSDSGVHYCAAPPTCAAAPVIFKETNGWGAGLAYDDKTQLLVISLDHYSGTDKIVTCPATAAACNPTNVVSPATFPRGVAAGGGIVYFIETGTGELPDGGPSNDGKVSKCTLDGTGACSTPIVIAAGLMSPSRITLDQSSIYFTNEGLVNNFGVAGSLMKAPR